MPKKANRLEYSNTEILVIKKVQGLLLTKELRFDLVKLDNYILYGAPLFWQF